MSRPHAQAPGVVLGGRFTGRWRYDRAAGGGIALTYDRSSSRKPAARLADIHAGGRLAGRWRYNRVLGRGIALAYDHSVAEPPAPAPAPPEPIKPAATHSGRVRVLCSCGDDFTFEGDAGICPSCGRPAEWPTMGVIEREMRADLKELLSAHERGAEPD